MTEEETKPRTFTSIVPPSKEKLEELTKEDIKQAIENEKDGIKPESLDTSILTAQQKVFKGLSEYMTDFQIQNMKKLAPQDEFEIPIGSGKIYKRNKMKPNMLRELRKAEREYNEDILKITDPDLKQDRDWQLLYFKARLYFNMTEQEFEDTDIEYLQTVIQATELRTQGFRQY